MYESCIACHDLPMMLVGMLGIFLVIGVIILAVYLLNKITGSHENKD